MAAPPAARLPRTLPCRLTALGAWSSYRLVTTGTTAGCRSGGAGRGPFGGAALDAELVGLRHRQEQQPCPAVRCGKQARGIAWRVRVGRIFLVTGDLAPEHGQGIRVSAVEGNAVDVGGHEGRLRPRRTQDPPEVACLLHVGLGEAGLDRGAWSERDADAAGVGVAL